MTLLAWRLVAAYSFYCFSLFSFWLQFSLDYLAAVLSLSHLLSFVAPEFSSGYTFLVVSTWQFSHPLLLRSLFYQTRFATAVALAGHPF